MKSEMGLIGLKVIPQHSDQQRFYYLTKHPKTHSFQSIHPTPIPHEKPTLTTCTLMPRLTPSIRKKKNCQAINCDARTCDSGLLLYTYVTGA